MNAWVIHRNKAVFGQDADEFRPERWLIDDKEKLSYMNQNYLSVCGVPSEPQICRN
jgi:cytochrome P450